jgi:hypothetical protein
MRRRSVPATGSVHEPIREVPFLSEAGFAERKRNESIGEPVS